MCVNIPEGECVNRRGAFQRAVFLFWRGGRCAANPEIYPDVLGLRLISSKSVRYRSVGRAVNSLQQVFENKLKETFYQQIGASLLKEIDPHPLLGNIWAWVNGLSEADKIFDENAASKLTADDEGLSMEVEIQSHVKSEKEEWQRPLYF
jgi:hypothetical protein